MNYHHLHLFWCVVKAGGVTRAGQQLGLTQSTISTQLKLLDEAIGNKLLEKQGRELVLTDAGRVAFQYAENIFGLGTELLSVLKGQVGPGQLVVGVSDVVPKMIAHRLLAPVFSLENPPFLRCVEGQTEELLADLAVHRVDLVLTDAMMSSHHPVRAYHHRLGECGVCFVAAPSVVAGLKGDFPKCLEGAPFLLPSPQAAIRRGLEDWFGEVGVRPVRVAEFEDAALMKSFGQGGRGVLAVPAATIDEVCASYNLREIGRVDTLKERFFAITVERKVRAPAILAIIQGLPDFSSVRVR